MKAFCILATIFGILIAISTAALSEEERREIEKKILDECKSGENASDEDVNTLLEHVVPKTESGKCLIACAHEKTGIIKDGQISIEALKGIGAQKYGNDEKSIALIAEIGQECASVTDQNRCELSTKLMQCMVDGAVKRGIDPKKGIVQN